MKHSSDFHNVKYMVEGARANISIRLDTDALRNAMLNVSDGIVNVANSDRLQLIFIITY